MADILTIIIVVLGIFYGFSNKGTEDYVHILVKGLKIGFFIGIIFGILVFVASGFIGGIVVGFIGGLLAGFSGVILFTILAVIITIEFIIGVLIGDVLEKIIRR